PVSFTDTSPTPIYTLSLHDALPILSGASGVNGASVDGLEQRTLEIRGFGHGHDLGVVPARPDQGEELEPAAGVPGGLRQHLAEHAPVHVVGAGAGEEHSPRGENAHRPQVDLL